MGDGFLSNFERDAIDVIALVLALVSAGIGFRRALQKARMGRPRWAVASLPKAATRFILDERAGAGASLAMALFLLLVTFALALVGSGGFRSTQGSWKNLLVVGLAMAGYLPLASTPGEFDSWLRKNAQPLLWWWRAVFLVFSAALVTSILSGLAELEGYFGSDPSGTKAALAAWVAFQAMAILSALAISWVTYFEQEGGASATEKAAGRMRRTQRSEPGLIDDKVSA